LILPADGGLEEEQYPVEVSDDNYGMLS
jgi:hypothetical protein